MHIISLLSLPLACLHSSLYTVSPTFSLTDIHKYFSFPAPRFQPKSWQLPWLILRQCRLPCFEYVSSTIFLQNPEVKAAIEVTCHGHILAFIQGWLKLSVEQKLIALRNQTQFIIPQSHLCQQTDLVSVILWMSSAPHLICIKFKSKHQHKLTFNSVFFLTVIHA